MTRFFILLLLCASTVYAQPYDMNIRLKDGRSVVIPVRDIQKLTFAGGLSAVGNERLATVVRTFAILQNYPNPFNPSTTIEYELPAAGNVEIRIFNVNGQLVRTLVSDHRSPGRHAALWDGTNAFGVTVASGLYVYQVTYGHAILSKKMLLVK
jgi:hypothetical protein